MELLTRFHGHHELDFATCFSHEGRPWQSAVEIAKHKLNTRMMYKYTLICCREDLR